MYLNKINVKNFKVITDMELEVFIQKVLCRVIFISK